MRRLGLNEQRQEEPPQRPFVGIADGRPEGSACPSSAGTGRMCRAARSGAALEQTPSLIESTVRSVLSVGLLSRRRLPAMIYWGKQTTVRPSAVTRALYPSSVSRRRSLIRHTGEESDGTGRRGCPAPSCAAADADARGGTSFSARDAQEFSGSLRPAMCRARESRAGRAGRLWTAVLGHD
jgi:hypothetical protein